MFQEGFITSLGMRGEEVIVEVALISHRQQPKDCLLLYPQASEPAVGLEIGVWGLARHQLLRESQS